MSTNFKKILVIFLCLLTSSCYMGTLETSYTTLGNSEGETETQKVDRILASKSCVDCNFKGSAMSNLNMVGWNSQGIYFSQSLLQNSDLSQSNLLSSNFVYSRLHNVKLTSSILDSADFSFASLENVDFSHVRGNSINFSGAGGVMLSFESAHMPYAKFLGFFSKDLNFAKANLAQSSFENAHLSNSIFDESVLKGANFTRARLSGSSMKRTVLTGAVFLGSGLNGVDFSESNMAEVFMEACDLTGSTLFSADHIESVTICNSVMPDGMFVAGCLGPGKDAELLNIVKEFGNKNSQGRGTNVSGGGTAASAKNSANTSLGS